MPRANSAAPVLLVEDEPDIRETLREVLESEGYLVQTAANGQEALDLIHHEKPALILLDLTMPVMNGYDVLRALKANGELAKIPVTIVSAIASNSNCGGTPFVTKPIDLDTLLEIVEKNCKACRE